MTQTRADRAPSAPAIGRGSECRTARNDGRARSTGRVRSDRIEFSIRPGESSPRQAVPKALLCVKVCPVGATYHRDDGLVMQDNDRCIGCRYCMIACPYGVRTFNWGQPERPTPHETGMVEARPVGTVEKCSMCVHRLAEDQVPSCVWSCPTGARIFGDLNDPTGRLVTLIREREGEALLEELGTRPSVSYLPPRRKQEV